jgi:4-hydroxybenzoate polyprenyltransferase
MTADGTRDRAAAKAVAINAADFGRKGFAIPLIKSLRLQQWAKNVLIFIPLILAGKFQSADAWTACILGFLAFSLLASASYIVNDARDISVDRLHWSKCARPLASGELPMGTALAAAALIGAASFGLAASLGRDAFLILANYAALTLLYSIRLKRVAILDVFVIAALFTLRLVLGIQLAKVAASPWLLVFSMFVFLSLSLGKRYTEVARSAALGRDRVAGRGYVGKDAPLLFGLGLATGVGAVLIMIHYLLNEAFAAGFYKSPMLLWALPAVLFLWLARYWLLAGRGELNDDPLEYAVKDRLSLAFGAAMAAIFVCAWQH